MFSEDEIIEIINSKINSDEKLGFQSGGSGHVGYADYEMIHFSIRQLSTDIAEITYHYIIYIETEFNYYPDNPPNEYHHTKTIVVNREKEVLSEG